MRTCVRLLLAGSKAPGGKTAAVQNRHGPERLKGRGAGGSSLARLVSRPGGAARRSLLHDVHGDLKLPQIQRVKAQADRRETLIRG